MQPPQSDVVDEAPAQPEAASTTESSSSRKPSVTVTDEGGATNGGSLGARDGEHEADTPVTPLENLSQDLNLLPSKGDALIHLLRLSARLMVRTYWGYYLPRLGHRIMLALYVYPHTVATYPHLSRSRRGCPPSSISQRFRIGY
jgi:hypothetical protein